MELTGIARGALELLRQQNRDGSWGMEPSRRLEDTCFALFFLQRATVTGAGELAIRQQQVDSWRRARLRELRIPADTVPLLRDWLLAGPWQEDQDLQLLQELPFVPARSTLRARRKVGGKTLERVVLHQHGWTDLEQLTGRGGDHLIWALGANLNVEVPAELSGPLSASLWLRVEDGWHVVLDGTTQSQGLRIASAILEDVEVPLQLETGHHSLWVFVHDEGGASAFSARLTDSSGGALPDGAVTWLE